MYNCANVQIERFKNDLVRRGSAEKHEASPFCTLYARERGGHLFAWVSEAGHGEKKPARCRGVTVDYCCIS